MIQEHDANPEETREWLDALRAVTDEWGSDRANYLIQQLSNWLSIRDGNGHAATLTTPYRNTIPVQDEDRLPGDLFMERRIRGIVRWNALAMVMRANMRDGSLGGHLSTFASAATLYEVGFNYFFRGSTDDHPGDLIYYQGHSSPGIYARSFLEGRFSEAQLDNFRREVDGNGLSSYPHPWLMPDYWQFPTVSMGLGPIQAIYQAHIIKYLDSRGLLEAGDRKIWAFLGDGEMDEPESLGAISKAGREKLDNLIFVINCNLQRLDGPVRGNGKIIQELESVFRGAGWQVIKVVWGRHWDALLQADHNGVLQRRMDEVVDGEFQNYASRGGEYTREHFFGKDPRLLEMVSHLSDEDIMNLNRGGHDPFKVYAAYSRAVQTRGKPTVILAKTVKGYAFGAAAEAQNATHSVKKLDLDSLRKFRDRFGIPISDAELENVPYYRPEENSPELAYTRKMRKNLGGPVPQRRTEARAMAVPGLDIFATQLKSSGKRELSTTMAFVRMLSALCKDRQIGERVVPIIPDEARTFGMEGMFRQLGIYSSVGQLYDPADSQQVMFYHEDKKGQMLEEGITEAGSFSAWLAAATSYSTNDFPLIPFYIYYSMFGFQRVGDLCWAAGDSQARGFLIGATAGRTTLNGEGLQHQDGHSHLLAGTIPNCVSYDPAYACELAVIIQDGLRRMYQEREPIYYYITAMNENYQQPALIEGSEEGIIRGMYLLEDSEAPDYRLSGKAAADFRLRLLGGGAILREARKAAAILRKNYRIPVDVWSVTSFGELRRNALAVNRRNLLGAEGEAEQAWVTSQLAGRKGPVIAATDHMKLHSDQIREFVPDRFRVLGTDGFGRSDSREKLREHFEVDHAWIVLAALTELRDKDIVDNAEIRKWMKKAGIDPDKPNPLDH